MTARIVGFCSVTRLSQHCRIVGTIERTHFKYMTNVFRTISTVFIQHQTRKTPHLQSPSRIGEEDRTTFVPDCNKVLNMKRLQKFASYGDDPRSYPR